MGVILSIYMDSDRGCKLYTSDTCPIIHSHSVASGPGRYIGQSLDNPDAFRRDTFLVPPWSYYVIRFVTDNRAPILKMIL